MKRKIQKGFTIVELVIVIAVIAVLASVLIPSFSNIIRRAQISADVQLCRSLNEILADAEAEGRIPGSVYDVLYLENEGGYVIENLNPTTNDMYIAWDQSKNRMIFVESDLETVYYPEDYTLNPGSCWITVGSAEEAQLIAEKGYNLALENDISEDIVLHNVVSIDTLGFKCQSVTMSDGVHNVETAKLIGQFGTYTCDTQTANIVTTGSVTSLNVSNARSVTVAGSVGTYSASSSVSSTVSNTGLVKTIASTNSSSITNNGIIKGNNSTATVSGNNVSQNVNGNVIAASTKEDLDSIRTQVATGDRTFAGETIKLSNDINLNGIAFTPISNFYRKNSKDSYFRGVFDGQGYAIKNFSTEGFSITGLNAGTNPTSVKFGLTKVEYNEACYGLFACAADATFKNFNVTCNIKMMISHKSKYVGDSIGGIVGFGMGNIVFENCVVSGSIEGYDGVGAFMGRCYEFDDGVVEHKRRGSVTFIDCTNNANIVGARKTSGFCGYVSGCDVYYNGTCVNNGNVTCKGFNYDVDVLGANEAKATSGHYVVSASTCGEPAATILTNFTNHGVIKVEE